MPDQSHAPHVVIVDDKLEMAEMLADGLADHGISAFAVATGKQALARIEAEPVDALVTDLRMPGMDGIELLTAARRAVPDLPVLVMTAYGALETAIESIRRGAYHYLTKPFKLDELVVYLGRALDESRVRREARTLRKSLRDEATKAGIIARSPAMRAALDVLARVAPSDAPVLLMGPTGAGKGLLARYLHAESGRTRGPFVTVNCAALPDPLLESELFGHAKGAFTGATTRRLGLFAEAEGGTMFLDEIGEMAPSLQAKLLDVLERRVVRPVGATKETPIDVRIVAATHRDLRRRVAEGLFREDLLYRLDVVPVHVPPLRERREDLPELAAELLAKARARHPTSRVERLSRECLLSMLEYPWPGNVRELAHAVERLVLLGREAEAQFADAALPHAPAGDAQGPHFAGPVQPLRELQQRYARWALAELSGNKSRTADRLGIDVKTLAKYLADDTSD
ncbi:sigma-54-dependent transcriptional regulator [Polyangium sorediatum]|uniref:Sigma-54 dependent transcriptional regulator n=1 Tax=Polyangium sorediatum TaxID=889274 RepID=A0ABT6NVF6_9BACT|nr:sigma-54 dependent transcriptional regulator [Polyangium sorediatum]MDI1432274.1 sigma-54 dependent transcriptional regulator [Polyangium sorediatum]